MDDPDVIAYLFAADGVPKNKALNVIYMAQNKEHFLPPRQHQVVDTTESASQEEEEQEALDRWEREGTEPPEKKKEDFSPFPHNGPCLMFRFTKPPRTRRGIMCGRSQHAEITTPQLKGISRCHFALTFDNNNRLIVRDLNSGIGTCMLYGSLSEKAEPGFNVDLSAEGPNILDGRPAIIKLLDDLQFKLVVPRHDITSETYLANVERFRQGTADAEDLLAGMELLSRAPTELPTPAPGGIIRANARVPGQILWKKELARGSFGVVYYVWDAQTRDEYALKKPLPEEPETVEKKGAASAKEKKKKKEPRFSVKQWRKEAELLNGLRHRNIVELKHYIVSDDDDSLEEPELYFEYVRGGSLLNYVNEETTSFHQEQVIFQVLSGLAYLHGQLPEPIVHRDIKLDNVLVESWGPDYVHVKLTDFGLSNRGKLLETFCGTRWYLAPEGYTKQTNEQYSPLVDIWSVGVLVFLLLGGEMPEYLQEYYTDSMAWAWAVVRSVRSFQRQRRHRHNDLLALAIEYMLIPDHEARRNVWDCLDGALRLKSVMETECRSSSSPEDAAESLVDSDGLEGGSDESSEPTTPRQAEYQPHQLQHQHLTDSNASTIRGLIFSLAERGDEAVDGLIGMAPSDESSFERALVDTPEEEAECGSMEEVSVTVPAATSMIVGDLWNWSAELEEGELVEGEEKEEERHADDQAEPEGSQPSFVARLHLFREMTSAAATETRASQYKRRFWDDDDEGSKGNDEAEEVVVYEVNGADIFGQVKYKKARLDGGSVQGQAGDHEMRRDE